MMANLQDIIAAVVATIINGKSARKGERFGGWGFLLGAVVVIAVIAIVTK